MKVVIVTGASSGIGKATAIRYLKDGWQVVLAGRRESQLLEAISESGVDDNLALAIQTDVQELDSVRQLFSKTIDRFGRLDVLFNNAGIGAPALLLEDLNIEDWKAVIDTNLTGPFMCTQEAFKIMKAQSPQGGRIINNGSISAHVPRPNSAPYTATKHAITGLTKSTSLDGRKYNIACSQIDIGNAATAMANKMQQGILQASGDIKVEPTMDIEQVVDAVLYISNLPLSANVQFMTVMATQMPYIGRG